MIISMQASTINPESLSVIDSILENRDITFPTKVHLVKAIVFLVVMYGNESWSRESWALKNWSFELWCWRRLLSVAWTARRSKQSIFRKISSGYSLEGLMLKLKFQHFDHLIGRTDWLERPWCWGSLKVRGEGDDRWWDGWMASLTQWT